MTRENIPEGGSEPATAPPPEPPKPPLTGEKKSEDQSDVVVPPAPPSNTQIEVGLDNLAVEEAKKRAREWDPTLRVLSGTTDSSVILYGKDPKPIAERLREADGAVGQEIRFYRVNYLLPEKVRKVVKAFDSEATLFGDGGAARVILLRARNRVHDFFKKYVLEMDRPPAMVLVDCKIAVIHSARDRDLGVKPNTDGFALSTLLNDYVKNNYFPFDGVFKDEQGKTTLLTQPQLKILEGFTAKLSVIDELLQEEKVETKYSTDTGQVIGTPLSTRKTEEDKYEGINLQLTDLRVHPDGDISMTILYQVSGFLSDIQDANNTPKFRKRDFQSRVRARNGEVIVLSGFKQHETFRDRYGVPLLSRIPLLGGLLSNRDDEHFNSEMVMFLTPRVIPDAEAKMTARVSTDATH